MVVKIVTERCRQTSGIRIDGKRTSMAYSIKKIRMRNSQSRTSNHTSELKTALLKMKEGKAGGR